MYVNLLPFGSSGCAAAAPVQRNDVQWVDLRLYRTIAAILQSRLPYDPAPAAIWRVAPPAGADGEANYSLRRYSAPPPSPGWPPIAEHHRPSQLRRYSTPPPSPPPSPQSGTDWLQYSRSPPSPCRPAELGIADRQSRPTGTARRPAAELVSVQRLRPQLGPEAQARSTLWPDAQLTSS